MHGASFLFLLLAAAAGAGLAVAGWRSRRRLRAREPHPPVPASAPCEVPAAPAAGGGAATWVLPGIRTELGLGYCAGREDVYRRMLERFRDGKARAGADLRQALGAGDLETAQRLVHTLKSTAMTLGAEALSWAARDLEEALLRGGRPPEAAVACFEARLEVVVEGLRKGLGE